MELTDILDSSCNFQVARRFTRRHSTMEYLWNKFQQTNNVNDLPRQPQEAHNAPRRPLHSTDTSQGQVFVKEMFSSHGVFLAYTMHHHRETS